MEQNELGQGYSPAVLKRDSLIFQAVEEICRFIDATGLQSGDALPPETRLSEMLSISRNSVREAIRTLHGLGVVEKVAGRGAVVTAVSTAGFGAVDEAGLMEAASVAHEVRMITMQRCAELAAARLSASDFNRMESALDALATASAVGDRPGAKRAHDIFYGAILSGAHNPLLVSLFNQASSARLTNVSEPADKTFLASRHMEQHRAVLKALLSRDAEAAAKAVRRHFLTLRPMIEFVAGHAATGGHIQSKRDKAS
jgi:GntR family transcriptional repressor for pyruvate dehydrogenase complex